MKNYFLLAFIGLVVVSSSCKRALPTDLDSVVVPYSVFFGTQNGQVINTSDGVHFRNYFYNDGSMISSVKSTGNNLIFGKAYLHTHLFADKTSNISYTGSEYLSYYIQDTISLSKNICYNESDKMVYATSISGAYLYSDNKGQSFQLATSSNFNSSMPSTSISFVEFGSNGTYFSSTNQKLYFRSNASSNWDEVNVNNSLPSSVPAWRLSKFGNKIVAYDPTGIQGIYLAQQTGNSLNFSQAGTFLSSKMITSIVSFEGKYMYIATRGDGLFRYDGSGYTHLLADIGSSANVTDIAIKTNIYRTGASKQFVYVSTETGLWKSEDWGNTFTNVYKEFVSCVD